MINVAIIDDHKLFLEGIKSILEIEPDLHITGVFSEIEYLKNYLLNHTPDVLLADLYLNNKEIWSDLDYLNIDRRKILALSMSADSNDINKALDYNFGGYLLKSSDKSEVMEGIKSVASGNRFLCKEAQQVLLNNWQSINGKNEIDNHAEQIKLSEREMRILDYIADDKTIEEIAEAENLSTHSINYYKRKLFEKFNVNKSTSLLVEAVKLNLVKPKSR